MRNPSRLLGIFIITVGLIAGIIAEANAQIPEGTTISFERISDSNSAMLLTWEYNASNIDLATVEQFIYGGYGDYEIIIIVTTTDNSYEIFPQYPIGYLMGDQDGLYNYNTHTNSLQEAIEYACSLD